MILVLKNNQIIATHSDEQKNVYDKYEGCDFIITDKKYYSGDEDPRNNWTIEEVKENAIKSISIETCYRISEIMPDWRIVRWKSYCELYEIIQSGGSLNVRQQKEYDAFLDTETHEVAYNNAVLGLNWISDTIEAHKICQVSILNATTIEEIKSLKVNYPIFPL